MYTAIFVSFIYSIITFVTVRNYLEPTHTLIACFTVAIVSAFVIIFAQSKEGVPPEFK